MLNLDDNLKPLITFLEKTKALDEEKLKYLCNKFHLLDEFKPKSVLSDDNSEEDLISRKYFKLLYNFEDFDLQRFIEVFSSCYKLIQK